MAFPTVKARSGGSSGGNSVTESPITFPTHASGDLLVIFFASDASATGPTHTFDGGFTEAKDFLGTTSGTPTALAVGWKIAASASETCTVTTSQSEKTAHITICYDSGSFNSSDPLGVSTGVEGTGNIDPDSLTSAGGSEDIAWVAFGSLDQGQAVTAAPTNYGNLQTQSSSGGGSSTAATAERNLAAASEDPGAFTNTSEDWVAVTVGIRPAAGGTTETRTHTADALLKATAIRTHTADAALKATQQATHTADAVLRATLDADHTTDAILLAEQSVTHTADAVVGANTPPNAPTLVAPADDATIDGTVPQTFDWTFSDPDAGDTQSAWALRRKTT